MQTHACPNFYKNCVILTKSFRHYKNYAKSGLKNVMYFYHYLISAKHSYIILWLFKSTSTNKGAQTSQKTLSKVSQQLRRVRASCPNLERTNNSKSWQALGSHHHFIFIQNFVEPFWKRNYVLVRNDWILKVSLNVVQLYLKTSDLLSTCVFGKLSRNKTSL